MMTKAYDFWITWVYGGPWFVTMGEYLMCRHRSGIICHLHAILWHTLTGEPRGAWGDFHSLYNNPKDHYVYG